MYNFITHLDKFHFSFQTDLSILSSYSPNFYFQLPKSKSISLYDRTFIYHREIYYKESFLANPLLIGYLNLKQALDTDYSFISLTNHFLYTNNFQNILDLLICTYNFQNIKIRRLELAIDTNEPILVRFINNFQKITINKGYYAYRFVGLDEEVNLGYTVAKKYSTIYIKTLKDKQTNKNRHRILRIENKTNELKYSKKDYILNYLSDYLNIEKTIYRMELILTNENAFSNSHTKQTVQIDFTRLTDHEYLSSVFNYYNIVRSEKILDTESNVPLFNPLFIDNKPKIKEVKIVKNNEKKIVNDDLLIDHYKKHLLNNLTDDQIASLINSISVDNKLFSLDNLFKSND